MMMPLIITIIMFAEPTINSHIPLSVSSDLVTIRVRKCIDEIVHTYLPLKETMIIIAGTYGDDKMQINQFPIPLYLIVPESSAAPKHYQLHHDIVLVETRLPIPEVLKKIPWNHKSKFVVIPKNRQETSSIFRGFWAERIVNVAIIINHEENSEILTYFPHSEKKCSQVALITEVGVCSDTHYNVTNLYPNKFSNMQRCPLKTTVLIRPPYVEETPAREMIGIEIEILKIVAKFLNATPVFESFHKMSQVIAKPSSAVDSLMMVLTEKHSDVVAGSLMYTESVSSYSAAVSYYETQCVTFVVPKAVFSAEYAIVTESSRSAGFFILIIAAGFLITPFIWYFVKKEKIRNPLKIATKVILDPLIGGFIKSPKTLKTFVIVYIWLFQCNCYWRFLEADVSSRLIAPPDLQELETAEDVFNADTTITGEFFLINEILKSYSADKERKASISPSASDVIDALKTMVSFRNISYFGTYSNILHILSLNAQYQKFVHLQEKCTAKYTSVFQTEKNSPYLEEITKRVEGLAEFGITRKLFQRSHAEIQNKIYLQNPDAGFSPMILERVITAFALLFLGLSCSLACFLTECLVFNVKQKFQRWKLFH